MSCGALDQLSALQLLKIFSNNSGLTPNIYVSIHGGELPSSNVDSYHAGVAAIKPDANMREEVLKLFTAIVPADLIVVKFSVPFCNNLSDAVMEADLRYWWSSPLWAATTTGMGPGGVAANILHETCTIYGPGQRLYNQWMGFDDSDYFNIYSLPHFQPDGRLAPNQPGSGDPRRAPRTASDFRGGAGNVNVGGATAWGQGITLKQWAKAAARVEDGENYTETLNYRHFDMQSLLNYLSTTTLRATHAGQPVVQHHIATGPRMNADFADRVADVPAPPLRVVYFYSCAPRPDPENWISLVKALYPRPKSNPPSAAFIRRSEEITQNIFGGRQVMYEQGQQCFRAIKTKLETLRGGGLLTRPQFNSWQVWCLQHPQIAGQNCNVVGSEAEWLEGAGGGDPMTAAIDHFNLYWQYLPEGQGELYGPSSPRAAGGPDSQGIAGAETQDQYTRFTTGGQRRQRKRRRKRRKRRTRRKRRRRRRTRRKRKRKKNR